MSREQDETIEPSPCLPFLVYDGTGARVKKIGSETTRYYLSGSLVVNETVDGSLSATNLIGAGFIARQDVNANPAYMLTNGHGDVTNLIRDGAVVATYDYNAYGEIIVEEEDGIQNPIRYASEYFDKETGLVYLRARYYDPGIGRFVSEDPMRADGNFYAYANNNPLRFTDPTGYWAADGSDERFKDSNPIVYEAIGDLSKTWENLDALEKAGVDIGNRKAEVAALCNEVRRIGDSTTVTTKTITFLWKTANLNATEAVIYASDTGKGWDMLVAGNTAIDDTAKMFDNSGDSTPGNAFQHAYWNALGAKATGDANYVKFYTDAHEFGNPYTTSSAEEFAKMDMDLFNNGVGRYQQSLNPKASNGDLKKIIYQRLKDGGLRWIREGDKGNKYAP